VNTEGTIKQMYNLEKLATSDTQDEEKQHKNTTQYASGTTMRNQTEIKIARHTALQIIGGKDEPSIVSCGTRNGHHNTELRA